MRITIDIEFSEETTQLLHATIKKVQNLIPGKAFNISIHEPPENTPTPEETTDKGNDVEPVFPVPKSKKPRKIRKNFRQNILKLINQNEGLSPQEIQTMTGLRRDIKIKPSKVSIDIERYVNSPLLNSLGSENLTFYDLHGLFC